MESRFNSRKQSDRLKENSTTSSTLKGRRVAILATDGFEQSELADPRKALQEAGAQADIISLTNKPIKGWKHTEWGDSFDVQATVDDVLASDFDALLLPGGVMNPDKLRANAQAVKFVKAFFEQGKPVAAICHGPQTLIEAGVVKGRSMTSYNSIKSDLINAGAKWVDKEVVVDHGLITSRQPSDIPAFNRKMIEEFAEGIHEEQKIGKESLDSKS
jgi:protease I